MSNKCTSNDNIDNLAQSFFITLIFCALLNDSYSIINNFFNTEYIQKKMKYGNHIFTAVKYIFTNDYEKDKRGNIIIKKKNEIKETISKLINNISPQSTEDEHIPYIEEIVNDTEKLKEEVEEVMEEPEIIEKKIHKVKKEHRKNIKEEKIRKIKPNI
jgi:seryl-tRNA synthetase